jgi:hypothetical protein
MCKISEKISKICVPIWPSPCLSPHVLPWSASPSLWCRSHSIAGLEVKHARTLSPAQPREMGGTDSGPPRCCSTSASNPVTQCCGVGCPEDGLITGREIRRIRLCYIHVEWNLEDRPDVRKLGWMTGWRTNRTGWIGPDAKWYHEGEWVHWLTWRQSRMRMEVRQQSNARAKHANYQLKIHAE